MPSQRKLNEDKRQSHAKKKPIRRNAWRERFWKRLRELSVNKDEACITEWNPDLIRLCETWCICGHVIRKAYVVRNSLNGKLAEIGSCCAKRFGIKERWRHKADYLTNALLYAQEPSQTTMIKHYLDKLPRYGGGLIITTNAKRVLERITGHRWRGKVWHENRTKKGRASNAEEDPE